VTTGTRPRQVASISASPVQIYFFRDQQGLDVDFIVPLGGKALALIEARATRTPRPAMAKLLERLALAPSGNCKGLAANCFAQAACDKFDLRSRRDYGALHKSPFWRDPGYSTPVPGLFHLSRYPERRLCVALRSCSSA
jgi:hypothetical protein